MTAGMLWLIAVSVIIVFVVLPSLFLASYRWRRGGGGLPAVNLNTRLVASLIIVVAAAVMCYATATAGYWGLNYLVYIVIVWAACFGLIQLNGTWLGDAKSPLEYVAHGVAAMFIVVIPAWHWFWSQPEPPVTKPAPVVCRDMSGLTTRYCSLRRGCSQCFGPDREEGDLLDSQRVCYGDADTGSTRHVTIEPCSKSGTTRYRFCTDSEEVSVAYRVMDVPRGGCPSRIPE